MSNINHHHNRSSFTQNNHWLTTSQTFFSNHNTNQTHQNLSKSKPFGKPSKQNLDWKTCSHNYLKHYHPDTKSHDVINLQSKQSQIKTKTNIIRGAPIRNMYNIISNQKIPDFYLNNKQIKLPVQHFRKNLSKSSKQYNLLSGQQFQQKHKNSVLNINSQNTNQIKMNINLKLRTNKKQKNIYNPIFSRYYDQNDQTQYLQKKKILQAEKVESSLNIKLPPSYMNRQPLILDRTKPTSEGLKLVDKIKMNAKRRYKVRYQIQDLYQQKNLQLQHSKYAIIRNKSSFNKLLQSKKEFNIINHQKNFVQKKFSGTNDQFKNFQFQSIKSNGFSKVLRA